MNLSIEQAELLLTSSVHRGEVNTNRMHIGPSSKPAVTLSAGQFCPEVCTRNMTASHT